MSYQVIARKWRPQTFADVVGQQHVTRTLSNAIQSGRVAHAYIFSGARGVGKTTTARILAKALNCAKGPAAEPCNECDSCREIGLGNSLDVIEIDAASNRGIDQIRELREMVRYAPAGGRYKVVILDEAHMLTDEASNALLKTLEEPPDKVIFVMATTEPENLADTIRSRSQHFHFRALSFAEISDALEEICVKESLTAEPGAIAVMARAAEGSLRDGLSLLEQARAYCGSNITDAQVRELLGVVPGEILDELTGAIEERSAERVLSLVHRLLAEGQNLQHFCREAIGHFRNLLVARVCGADSELIAAPADERPRLKKACGIFQRGRSHPLFPDPSAHRRRSSPQAGCAPAPGDGPAAHGECRAPGAARRTSCRSGGRNSRSCRRRRDPQAHRLQAPPIARASAPAGVCRGNIARRGGLPLRPRECRAAAPRRASKMRLLPRTVREEPSPVPARMDAAPAPAAMPARVIARSAAAGDGLVEAQVDSIKSAIVAQEKFLGELVGHASRWEMSGGEVRLFFPTESRALAEMLQARDPMERLRNIASRILGHTVRVCVKLEAVPAGGGTTSNGTRELRAKFEQDPIVRAMLERFGGQISDVKRRGEE